MSGKSICQVIVIGAGISGLAAAHTLFKQGISIKILEARNVYGGRISKNTEFADFPIETGAEEIHFKESNYFDLVQRVGGQVLGDDEVEHYIEDIDNIPSSDQFQNKLIEREEFFEKSDRDRFYDQMESLKKSFEDGISIEQFLQQRGATEQEISFFENLWGIESGTNIKKISVQGFIEYEKNWESSRDTNYALLNMSHFDVLERAFSDVFQFLSLNSPVVSIDYSSNNSPIIIKDIHSNQYECEFVIITVPLTQLQNSSIKFIPDLPNDKIEAINKMNLGVGGKLHLSFSKQFWPDDFGSVLLNNDISVLWNCSNPRKSNSNVLCSLIIEQTAQALNDKVKFPILLDRLLSKLEEVFQVQDLKSQLLKYHWVEYSQIKYIEGNYLYPTLNMANNKKILSLPIRNKIFFAGEATNPTFSATVNGAMDTGLREAKNILNVISQKKLSH